MPPPVALRFAELRSLLPVRPPMLLVDRVVVLDRGTAIETVKAVSGGEPCYLGLAESVAPRRCAYPRALVLESFGQSAALLWLASTRSAGAGDEGAAAGVPVLGRLRRCSFGGDAFPGDVLCHRVRVDAMSEEFAVMSGVSLVGDAEVLRVASLTAMIRPADVLTNRSAGATWAVERE